VHANTLGAAYQIRSDALVGSLEVGKLADLIVLDKNISV
jgi:predicted amidohydrolase YtcJ